jgi:hypothetical protein
LLVVKACKQNDRIRNENEKEEYGKSYLIEIASKES